MAASDPHTFRHDLVDVHGNYRAGRTGHQPPDDLISDLVTTRTLRPHVVRSLVFLVVQVFLVLCWFLTALIALISNPLGAVSGSRGSSGFATLVGFLIFIVGVAWIASLFLPLREPIAEYGVLVEGRAHVLPFVFGWIAETVMARQSPFQLRLARSSRIPVLLAANERVRGLVSVRQVGTDLFLSWYMWRNRSTVVVLGHMVRDMFQRGQAWAPAEVIRAGWAAAMRELLHSVTREGAQAAMLDSVPSGFMSSVRIEDLPEIDGAVGAAPVYTGGAPTSSPQASTVPGTPDYLQPQAPPAPGGAWWHQGPPESGSHPR